MENYEEIELIDIIKTIWKEKIQIIVIIFIAICCGLIYTSMIEPKYKSTAKILIDKNDTSIENMINNVDIVNGAVEQLGRQDVDSKRLIESRKTSFDKNAKTITLTFTTTDRELSYQMIQAYIEPLKTKLEEIYMIKLYNVMEEAQIATNPYNVNLTRNMIVAIGLGIIVCGVYILVIINRKGISKESTIENNGLILLGKIKKNVNNDKKVISYVIREEEVQEEIRKIIAKIEFNKNAERPKAILFTATREKIGNSYVVANLAFKNAKLGKEVLIIDANLNNPMQHKIFNVNETPGLVELLATDENALDKYINNSSIEKLSVLPHGTSKGEETLNIDRFIQILQKLKNKYDVILIDGMPVTEEVLTIALANIVDTTVIIVEHEKTKIEELQNTKRLIQDINGKISGVIMNKI